MPLAVGAAGIGHRKERKTDSAICKKNMVERKKSWECSHRGHAAHATDTSDNDSTVDDAAGRFKTG